MTTTLRISLLACAGVLLAGSVGAVPLLKDSPFLPPAGSTVVAPPPETLQLSGVITAGDSTLVNITDSHTKRSLWIPVGKTVDGVEVLSCDLKTDTVVARTNGEVKTLKLRSATIVNAPVTAPMQGPINAGGVAGPAPILTQAEQEREARMLVSDLLEIGLQQRKAYEEAQRKAAAAKAKK